MAPAYAYIISNIFYADRVGIVGGNIGNSFLDIVAGTVILFIIAGMFHKKSQRLIESSSHFYRIHEIISAGFIDTEKVFPDGFGKRRLVNQWKIPGKICGIQNNGSVTAIKAYPGILPRIFFIGIIGDFGLRVDKEGISGGKGINFTTNRIISFAG